MSDKNEKQNKNNLSSQWKTDCLHFNGYKPCGKSVLCSECVHYRKAGASVLLIHLGAIGAVLRSTSLLAGIENKYPNSQVTWVTESVCAGLLQNHPRLRRVLTLSNADLLQLEALSFDIIIVVDKSLTAVGIADKIERQQALQNKKYSRFGFRSDQNTGAILPATDAAKELWLLGLSNEEKFFKNIKSEVQLMYEAFELSLASSAKSTTTADYDLPLSVDEFSLMQKRRGAWQKVLQPIVGINTGCSGVIAHKKLSISGHRRLIAELLASGMENIVLLGGPEDTQRNQEIAIGLPVIQSPTTQGLRDGLVSVAACDIVITGDSLGMHMAISQKKYVVAWFGPTCAHEIELYGRGQSVQTLASCAPCWKRSCDKSVMCYDLVDFKKMAQIVSGQAHQQTKKITEMQMGKQTEEKIEKKIAENTEKQDSHQNYGQRQIEI